MPTRGRPIRVQEAASQESPVLNRVLDLIKGLNARLTELEEPKGEKKEEIKPAVSLDNPSDPVPQDYSDAVARLLNRHFGVRVRGRRDMPVFELEIIVPKKYSPATEEYLQMYKEDRRLKVLNYSDGLLGVEEYIRKVASTFNQETLNQINLDKLTDQLDNRAF